MESINFDQANLCLKAEGCGDLFSHKNDREIISVWILSDEDVKRIFSGERKVYLRLMGSVHPPVNVTMDPPFGS